MTHYGRALKACWPDSTAHDGRCAREVRQRRLEAARNERSRTLTCASVAPEPSAHEVGLDRAEKVPRAASLSRR
jgi:hypothetical protein